MKVNKSLQILGVAILIAILSGCGSFFAEEPTPEPVPVNAVSQPNVVSAEAFVIPRRDSDLAFEVGGRVIAVNFEEGDAVEEGDLIAEVDNTSQKAALAEAEAGVAEALANLADVRAGATPEEIAEAEARLAKAEAVLADIVAGPTDEEVAETEAGVEVSRAELAEVLAGSRDEDIQAAAAQLLQAEAEVRIKQADYDENIYGEPDRAEPFGIALQKATLDFEAAQAEYDKLVAGATEEEVAISRARLFQSQASLQRLLAGASAEEIAQAQADVQIAEAALANVEAGATQEQIGVAEAAVDSARARVDSAEATLQKTQLVAPFAGTIGSLDIEEGEIAQAGEAVTSVGDTSEWQIETDDLTEIDIVGVQEGSSVTISVDALPEQEFKGRVIRVQPKSETKAGDVTYTVLIEITEGNTDALRWGMTTFVDIEVDPEL